MMSIQELTRDEATNTLKRSYTNMQDENCEDEEHVNKSLRLCCSDSDEKMKEEGRMSFFLSCLRIYSLFDR